MKLLLLISFIFIILFSSCSSTTVYQLQTNCDKLTIEELFKSITNLLLKEDFIIKQSDLKSGILLAETIPVHNIWSEGDVIETRAWTFQFSRGKVIATAIVIIKEKNNYGKTTATTVTYCNDLSKPDWKWYWNVRNGLEKLCGNKILIEEKATQ
jgi:hypothetical protein